MGKHRSRLEMSMYMLRLLEKEDRTQTALVYKTVLCQKTGLEIIQELVEKALAHTERNKVRRAYQRHELIEERRPMMEAWGTFVNNSTSKPPLGEQHAQP